MALIVRGEDATALEGMRRYWTYCGFDCAGTREVYDVLRPCMDPAQERVYRFRLACQGPAMQMMLRGLDVDEGARIKTVATLTAEFEKLKHDADALVGSLWTKQEKETGTCPKAKRKDGKHSWPREVPDTDMSKSCTQCGGSRWVRSVFNPMSDDQCQLLLYGVLGLEEETNKTGNVSTDKEILDRIERKSAKARPFVKLIKGCRQTHKMMEMLAQITDGKFWYSMSVGATETGRWSSTDNPYQKGGNAQNITEKLRRVFVPSPGKRFFVADFEQAESNVFAHIAGDDAYIAAHKEGDIHTVVARMCWPEFPWTGDTAKDKKLAESTFPAWDNLNPIRRHAKVNAHGTNYVKSPMGVARDAHIPVAAAKEFQDRYFEAFPMIRPYHHWVARQILEKGELTTPLGWTRRFFGRRHKEGGGIDGHTHRQAVAFVPQSTVVELLNVALWRMWVELDPAELEVLVQHHDAVMGQVPAQVAVKSEKVFTRLLELMRLPVDVKGVDGKTRRMVIPVDVKIGDNWGKHNADAAKGPLNEGGLK